MKRTKQRSFLISVYLFAAVAVVALAVTAAVPGGASDGADPPPAVPTGLATTVSHDLVTLSWDDPGDDTISGYVILRRDKAVHPRGTFVTLAPNTGTAATTYIDASIDPERRYVYRVKAVNAAGTSDRSTWVRAYTPVAPAKSPALPARPRGLTTEPSHDTVALSWNDPADGTVTGYVILRRDKDVHPRGTFQTINADTGTAATSYLDATAEPERRYVYRIKAVNSHGYSTISSWARGYTPAAPPAVGDAVNKVPENGTPPGPGTRANVSEGGTDLPADATTTGQVDVGGTVTGTIGSSGDNDWFRVELEAGTRYQIDLEGSQTGRGTVLDPVINGVRDADGDAIDGTLNDDSGLGFNARTVFTPTASGTHYIDMRAAEQSDTGIYTLSVIVLGANGVSESALDFPAAISTTGRVEVGGSATGNLGTADDVDWFGVDLEADDYYRIDLEGMDSGRGTQPDPSLEVRDGAGVLIASNDDTLVNFNSALIFGPTVTGTYYLGALSAESDAAGTYTLSVTEFETRTAEDGGTDFAEFCAATTGRVDVGGSSTGAIEPVDDIDAFSVVLDAGKTYVFDLEGSTTAGDLTNPSLQLFNAENFELRRDDDGGDGLNSRIEFMAVTSGLYCLRVSSQSTASVDAGTYTLSVRDTTVVTPPPDDPVTPPPDDSVTPPPDDAVTPSAALLLGNFGQGTFFDDVEVGRGIDWAQGFTTGSSPGGYRLSSVELDVVTLAASRSDVTVALWSATGDDPAEPDASVAVLAHSTGTWVVGVNAFDAPAGTELDPDTTYFVQMAYNSPAEPSLVLNSTVSASVEGAPDWSLGDTHGRDSRSDMWRNYGAQPFVFRINGSEAVAPAVITEVTVTSSPGPGGIYGAGDIIEITVTFSEAVSVTGDPVFEFCVGDRECRTGNDPPSRRRAVLSSGSGTDMLVFAYVVGSDDDADRDTDGIWIGDHTRTLKGDAGDAIQSVATGNDAVLDHERLGTQSDHRVDGSLPGNSHGHQEFTHSHTHFNDGKRYYTQDYPDHTHRFHAHPNTDNDHPTWMRPGRHVHHEQQRPMGVFVGPDTRMHDNFAHTHICRDITPSCNSGDNFFSGSYGGVLPREVTHSHADSEPGHRYDWPDLTADGNRPAQGEPYVGWGAWRVAVGTTLSVDMWRVTDPDGMAGAALRYQWLAGYAEIPGATGAAYTVTAADVGKTVRVRVSFTDDAGNEEVLRSRNTLTAIAGGQ